MTHTGKFNENKAIGRLTEIIALERGYTPEKAKQIKTAAILHDVGKTKISREILDKPDKLNPDEFAVVKNHTKIGAELLSSLRGELGEKAKLICLLHHEWHEPSLGGYWGLSSRFLPDYISFVSVADVYISLISKRPYKTEWSKLDALEYIKQQAGTQFCHKLVDDFVPLIQNDKRIPAIFIEREE